MVRGLNFSKALSVATGVSYSKRTPHKGGKHYSAFQHSHFIAWDGEGITRADKEAVIVYDDCGEVVEHTEYQAYALLMNNEGVEVVDSGGISTLTCLEAIMNATNDKRAIHVFFGGSYDANMILHGVSKDISESLLRRLYEGYPIDYGKYQISYRPHKELTIREYMTVAQKYRVGKNGKKRGWFKKHVTLWDVYGFFGSSFIKALKSYFIKGNKDASELERWSNIIAQIKKGKDLRGSFTDDQLRNFVQPYCKLEVDALCELMIRLQGYLASADIKISRWDGAGACAAAVFKKYNIKQHIDEKFIPQEVVRGAEYAFYGGRIETLLYGNYEDTVYHADLNSAYPSAMSVLPSLAEGNWLHVTTSMSKEAILVSPLVSLFLISWHCRGDIDRTVIGPFPWRDPSGRVYFPSFGKGWVWGPEVKIAVEYMKEYDIFVHDCWQFHASSDALPFNFIRELYEVRRGMVANNNGAEKVIKLALNSLYGKTAQSIGYNKEEGKKPPYHSMTVAGMVTSMTRAKMLEVALQHPNDVIMLATDGIYSRKPLSVLGMNSTEKRLGEWEVSEHTYITIVASGVYWYKSEGEDENAFSRGFDEYSIMRDMVLEAWERGKTLLKCRTTRFVGLGSAIGLHSFRYWCTWRTVVRELGLNMDRVAKRTSSSNKSNPRNGLVRTYASVPIKLLCSSNVAFPYPRRVCMSSKYSFEWDDEQLDGQNMRKYLDEVANTTA